MYKFKLEKEIRQEEYADIITEVLAMPQRGLFNRQDAKVKVWVEVYR